MINIHFKFPTQTITLHFSTKRINAEMKKLSQEDEKDDSIKSAILLSLPWEYLMKIGRFEVRKKGSLQKEFTVRQRNILKRKLLRYLAKIEKNKQANQLGGAKKPLLKANRDT